MQTESTPFAKLKINVPKNHPSLEHGGIWAEFYWSARAGINGSQVVTEFSAGKGHRTMKTNGGGYCKSSEALSDFYHEVFHEYLKATSDLEYRLRGTKFHKGGNYYEMSLNQFKNIDKAREMAS